MLSNSKKFLLLLICYITLSCDNQYSRHKIQDEPVFDEKYYNASLNAIEESIKKNPDNAEGYYKKAIVLSRINKSKDAEKAIEKAIDLENHPDYHLLATQLYVENGNPEKGLRSALQAEEAGMNNGWLFSMIAHLNVQQGNNSGAFEYMEKAIASDPKNPVNYINKGNLLLTIQDTSKALESLIAGLKLDSTNSDVLSRMTDIYIAQHQYKKAELLLNQKLQHHRPDQKTLLQSAFLQWKNGNFDSARRGFNKILENDSSEYLAYNYISLIEYQKKEYDSAYWYAEKTLSLKSNVKEAMLTMARVKDVKRQYYNALVQYDKLIQLDTSYTIAKVERARIQKKINNLARQKQQESAPVIPQIQQRF